jgi:hypothetical protein
VPSQHYFLGRFLCLLLLLFFLPCSSAAAAAAAAAQVTCLLAKLDPAQVSLLEAAPAGDNGSAACVSLVVKEGVQVCACIGG